MEITDLVEFIKSVAVMLTMFSDVSVNWDQWLRWMGLEEYIDCELVTDKGAAVVRSLFDWLWWSLSEYTQWLGLSDIYDSCSPDE